MAILTQPGRAALAAAIKSQPLHLAIGAGDPAWDGGSRPAEPVNASALIAEIGRRGVDEVHFVMPDAQGEVVVPTGRFKLSAIPTNHLFIRVRFDFEDAATSTVREQGLFVGCTTDPALPPGLRYFTPAQIVAPGILLVLQYSVPIVRQPSTRETFEFVVTF